MRSEGGLCRLRVRKRPNWLLLEAYTRFLRPLHARAALTGLNALTLASRETVWGALLQTCQYTWQLHLVGHFFHFWGTHPESQHSSFQGPWASTLSPNFLSSESLHSLLSRKTLIYSIRLFNLHFEAYPTGSLLLSCSHNSTQTHPAHNVNQPYLSDSPCPPPPLGCELL